MTMYGDSTFHSDICFPYDLIAGVSCPVLTGWMRLFWKSSHSNYLSMLCLCSLAVNAFYSPDSDHRYICQYVLLLCEVFSFSWQPQCKSLRQESQVLHTLLFVLSLSFLRTNASHRVMMPYSSAFSKDYRTSATPYQDYFDGYGSLAISL